MADTITQTDMTAMAGFIASLHEHNDYNEVTRDDLFFAVLEGIDKIGLGPMLRSFLCAADARDLDAPLPIDIGDES